MKILIQDIIYISTHALTEGDLAYAKAHPEWIFQLTPSRRATHRVATEPTRTSISTHALTEGDINTAAAMSERQKEFQLTPSRRATRRSSCTDDCGDISTHALTEGDRSDRNSIRTGENFNSRPHGGRRQCVENAL